MRSSALALFAAGFAAGALVVSAAWYRSSAARERPPRPPTIAPEPLAPRAAAQSPTAVARSPAPPETERAQTPPVALTAPEPGPLTVTGSPPQSAEGSAEVGL